MLKFYFKVFKTLYFLNPHLDLLHIWYNYSCWSKILYSAIHTPSHDLEVKVTVLEKMLKFYFKVFKTLYFLNPHLDLLQMLKFFVKVL